MRRAILVFVGAAAVTAIAVGGSVIASAAPRSASPTSAPATRLVPIVRTDLVARKATTGTVGASATWSISAVEGRSPVDVAALNDALANAKDLLTTANASSYAAVTAWRATQAADQRQIDQAAASGDAAAASVAQSRLAADKAQAAVVSDQAAASIGAATRAVGAAQRNLDSALAAEAIGGATITWMPKVGDTIAAGQRLFAVDGLPVTLLLGQTPAYRPLRAGETGADVKQLQKNLVDLGIATAAELPVDGTFGPTTTTAVKAWQARVGLAASGEVLLGQVVFLTDAVRVTTADLALGAAYASPVPILTVAASVPIVTIGLDPSLQSLLAVGDTVQLQLPIGTTVPGKIASIADIATTTTGSNGQSSGLTIKVTATADDPSALAHLDGAAVATLITTARAHAVLAVPINALVALAGGGYGVEIDSGGARSYVAVTPGLFSDTLVEVSGAGLAAGTNVVVPAE